ncbi:MAG: SpoIIE family protein phosphatase, partial [Planctomycetes bacterium]|nr:SpoIIE family protein phosphatase [Planctomycetota bacterium]
LSGRDHAEQNGIRVLVAETEVGTDLGMISTRIYRVLAGDAASSGSAVPMELFAPLGADQSAGRRLLVLVLMVTLGLVAVVVLFANITARRIARPLRAMIEDVLSISRGKLDRRIRTENSFGEVAMLGWAVERMVDDLVEGQETQQALEKRKREIETLRGIRRNLRPMEIDPPVGFSFETLLVDARGGGTGDFADALSDGDGRPTLVVGGTGERGMSGAMLMAMTRAYLRVAILDGHSPSGSCERANLALNRDLARGLFASAMVARLEPSNSEVELVSAGHSAPAIRWDAQGQQLRKLQPNGIALGFDKGPVFRKSMETLKLTLAPGDALFLFSPAAFEEPTKEGKPLGEAGVFALAKYALQHGLSAMEEKLHEQVGGSPAGDLAFALCRATPAQS